MAFMLLTPLLTVSGDFDPDPETSQEGHTGNTTSQSVNVSVLHSEEGHDSASETPKYSVIQHSDIIRHTTQSDSGRNSVEYYHEEVAHETISSEGINAVNQYFKIVNHLENFSSSTASVDSLSSLTNHTTTTSDQPLNLTDAYLSDAQAVQTHHTTNSTQATNGVHSHSTEEEHTTGTEHQNNNVSQISDESHHNTSSGEQSNNVSDKYEQEEHTTGTTEQSNNVSTITGQDHHRTNSTDQTNNVSTISYWGHHSTNSTSYNFSQFFMIVNLSLVYNYSTEELYINATAWCAIDGNLTENNTRNATYEILGTNIIGNLSWGLNYWSKSTNLSSLDPDVYSIKVRFVDNNSHVGAAIGSIDTATFDIVCGDNAHKINPNSTTYYTIFLMNFGAENDTYNLSLSTIPAHFRASLNRTSLSLASRQSSSISLTIKSHENATFYEIGNISVLAVSQNKSNMEKSIHTLTTIALVAMNFSVEPLDLSIPTPIIQQETEKHRDPKYSYSGEEVSNGTIDNEYIYARIYDNIDEGGPGIRDMWNKEVYPDSTPDKPHDVMWYGDYDYVAIDGVWQPQESNGTIYEVNDTITMVVFEHTNYTLYKIFEAFPNEPIIRVIFEIINKDNITHNYTIYYANDFCRGGSGGSKLDDLYLYNSTSGITESGWYSIWETTALVSQLNVGGTGGEDWTMLANFEAGAQFYAGKWTNAVYRNWTTGEDISDEDNSVGVKFTLGNVQPDDYGDVIYYIGTTNSHEKIDDLVESCVSTEGFGIRDIYVENAYDRYYAGTNISINVDTLSVKHSLNGTLTIVIVDHDGKEYLNSSTNVSMIVNQTETNSFSFVVPYEFGKRFDVHVYLYNDSNALISSKERISLIQVFGILTRIQNTGELETIFSLVVESQSPITTDLFLPTNISAQNITLGANVSINIPIRITIPNNASVGKYNITITARSKWVSTVFRNVTVVLMVPLRSFQIQLEEGLNFVSFPLLNQSLNASSLAELIGKDNVSEIRMFNETSGKYDVYSVSGGESDNDFLIRPTGGYWVNCTNDTTMMLDGKYYPEINQTLDAGWHALGWSISKTINASVVIQYLNVSQNSTIIVTGFDPSIGMYHSYIFGFSDKEYDFKISMGDALWLYVDHDVKFKVGG